MATRGAAGDSQYIHGCRERTQEEPAYGRRRGGRPPERRCVGRRLDIVVAAEAADLPDDLAEIVNLLPPGSYTRQRLCDQLNSAIGGHAWGQVYGTVQ